jgi:homocysteine S-methyltransferase
MLRNHQTTDAQLRIGESRGSGFDAGACHRAALRDESETLDAGDPADLGRRYRNLREAFPEVRMLGGCCGTDHRHVAAICEACLPPAALSA